MKKRMKHKTHHRKSEEKDEFGSFWSESFGFKCDTPIMLAPIIWMQFTHMDNVIFHS
jgi:hypothetical protein